MSALRVISPGLQTTVQDLGRFGWAHFGISASGAADPFALRAGNLLVGNTENAAAIEMTLLGGAFEFETGTVIALTGSDFGAGPPLWTPVEVKAGQTLRCGPSQSGARCYLCVRGGIGVPKTMGSASTHIITGVGGRLAEGSGRLVALGLWLNSGPKQHRATRAGASFQSLSNCHRSHHVSSR